MNEEELLEELLEKLELNPDAVLEIKFKKTNIQQVAGIHLLVESIIEFSKDYADRCGYLVKFKSKYSKEFE